MLLHFVVQKYGPADERTNLPSLRGPLYIGAKKLATSSIRRMDPSKRQCGNGRSSDFSVP